MPIPKTLSPFALYLTFIIFVGEIRYACKQTCIFMKRLFLLLALMAMCAVPAVAARDKGQAVIFETDMGNDIDDAMALDLLLKKHEQGVIDLLGVSVHKNNPCAAEFIDIMRRWYGHPHIPIGVAGVTVAECDDYATRVCRMTDSRGNPLFARSKRPKYEPAVEMYRRLLAAQPDGSVVIVSVGFSTTMAALLKSGPDRYSDLAGRDLVARKVKFFSVMGGEFEMEDYPEYNIVNDVPAAQYLFLRQHARSRRADTIYFRQAGAVPWPQYRGGLRLDGRTSYGRGIQGILGHAVRPSYMGCDSMSLPV